MALRPWARQCACSWRPVLVCYAEFVMCRIWHLVSLASPAIHKCRRDNSVLQGVNGLSKSSGQRPIMSSGAMNATKRNGDNDIDTASASQRARTAASPYSAVGERGGIRHHYCSPGGMSAGQQPYVPLGGEGTLEPAPTVQVMYCSSMPARE